MIKKEPLGNGIEIYVSEKHRFGTDAILLANFADPKRSDTVCDLGTGCGIIPFLWYRRREHIAVTGVEIQPDACLLAERSAEENGLSENFSVICSDLQDLKGKVPFGSFRLVTCNPPYKADGAGIRSKSVADKIARHEISCSLDDIIGVAAKLLQTSGRLCMCNRPERITDMVCSMREHGIEPKRMRIVCQRVGVEPWLVLLEGRRCGKPGLRIMPPLYIQEGENFSQEMIEIYGSYKEGHM